MDFCQTQSLWKGVWKPGCGFSGLPLVSATSMCVCAALGLGPFSALIAAALLPLLTVGASVPSASCCPFPEADRVHLSKFQKSPYTNSGALASPLRLLKQHRKMSELGGMCKIPKSNPTGKEIQFQKATQFLQNPWEGNLVFLSPEF